MTFRLLGRVPVLVALIVLMTACASETMSSNKSDQRQSETPIASVSILDFQFQPKMIEIEVGTKVVWTNQDSVLHTVTSGSTDGRENKADGVFALDLSKKGVRAEQVFNKAGTFNYFCSRHNVMNGVIKVG